MEIAGKTEHSRSAAHFVNALLSIKECKGKIEKNRARDPSVLCVSRSTRVHFPWILLAEAALEYQP